MAEEESELKRALNRRRRQVDRHGSQFIKSPEQAARTADVTWEEQHESQFTPRSRHQRAVDAVNADGGAASAEGGKATDEPSKAAAGSRGPSKEKVASSGDAAGGSPAPVGAHASSRLLRSGFAVPGLGVPEPAAEPATGRASSPGGSSASSNRTTSTVRVSIVPQPVVIADATVGMSTKPARVPGLALGTTPLLAWGDVPTARNPRLDAGNEGLWTAVVQGDLPTLERLTNQGSLTSGRLMDHNGHSILWNSVAFQQPQVALFLLRTFPPSDSSPTGINLAEVHARRGDSLLHLCLYLSDFTAAAAEVFRRVFRAGDQPQAPRELANQHGQTFVHVAAARLNFWVLRFILSNALDTAALFQRRDSMGHTPLDILLRRYVEDEGALPARPNPLPPLADARLPEWSALSRYTPCCNGNAAPPPFADLVLEVEDHSAPDGVAQVHAHRAVLAANSGVFHEQFRSHPLGEPLRVDPRCCRSAEVLAVVLGFMYSGELACPFEQDGFLLWQLLCLCAQYGLPQPLTTYARTALVHSLSSARHAPVVPVLLQAVDKVGLTSEEGLFAACIFLDNPEAAPIPGGFEGKAQVLLSALAEVELSLMRMRKASRTSMVPTLQQQQQQATRTSLWQWSCCPCVQRWTQTPTQLQAQAAGGNVPCLLQRQSSKLLVPAGSAGPACQPLRDSVGHEVLPAPLIV
uniref:BTB domain-containing protein n=1 Tax=Alexandrium monilatum TaxID=311494 RepID=A0A7S4RQ62_9DINO